MAKRTLPPITPDDVDRGVHLDFESQERGPITLLGVYVPDAAEPFRQYLLDPVFAPMAEHRSPSVTWPVDVLDPADVLDLLAGLRSEGRRLFSWSTHDRDVVRRLVDESGHDPGFDPADVEDAKAHAKKWKRRVHPDVEFPKPPRGGAHSLYNYESLIGFDRSTIWAGRVTGKRIAAVRRKLAGGATATEFTAVQKGYWTNLLIHNRLDCTNMHLVLREVAG
jgi:hypothetical protein